MQTVSRSDFHYVMHGIRVAANHPMSSLTPAPPSEYPDLCIWLGPMAMLRQRHPGIDLSRPAGSSPIIFWRQSTSDDQEVVVQHVNDPNLTLVVILAASGDSVDVGWQVSRATPPEEVERSIANYFLTAWLGMALRLSGRLVLHGNVVAVNGRALAWLGEKGVGKSTLTAAFVAAGYPLLSDDQIVPWFEANGVSVAHGIMRLHLWPESLAVMASVYDAWEFDQPFAVFPKGYMPMVPPTAAPVVDARTPLHALYVLQLRRADMTVPIIETPSPGDCFQLLYTHCLARRTMPLNPDQRRAEFNAVAELHRRVPVRLLTLPNDLARLPEVVQMLAEEHAHG